jgi:hypothetical protein
MTEREEITPPDPYMPLLIFCLKSERLMTRYSYTEPEVGAQVLLTLEKFAYAPRRFRVQDIAYEYPPYPPLAQKSVPDFPDRVQIRIFLEDDSR